MSKGFYKVPGPVNEPVKSYAPGSAEKKALAEEIERQRSTEIEIPMIIGGKEVKTGDLREIHPPHDIGHCLGKYHQGGKEHVAQAIEAAMQAKTAWEALSWEQRASIFLKAADLLAGPWRMKLNAATMLCQSKNAFQAEIDSACELIDFFRFNAHYMTEIYAQQPNSSPGMWNRLEQRPLEGFIFALTPFNFTSIAGNLPTAPALMGNTVVWKPSRTTVYSAYFLMQLFREAGMPDGVINLVYVSGPDAAEVVFSHKDFAGFHFTGSTEVFQSVWETIGKNIKAYRSYPRIVGETGGKDFIFAHRSADAKALSTAISRGAFEYQGQKCSAASRAYIPSNLWDEVLEAVKQDVESFSMGPVEDFSNFINAVIDEASFDKLAGFIERAKTDTDAEVVAGGSCDKNAGYFIEPTVIVAKKPDYITMCEELFGPVITLYQYDEDKYEEMLDVCDKTSIYALTGAIFAQDRYAIETGTRKLVNSAG
ncbi:MAG: L-glutamate gamma-semialdehyde dehydrogenase, partial [Flavobacteriales bacterium]